MFNLEAILTVEPHENMSLSFLKCPFNLSCLANTDAGGLHTFKTVGLIFLFSE